MSCRSRFASRRSCLRSRVSFFKSRASLRASALSPSLRSSRRSARSALMSALSLATSLRSTRASRRSLRRSRASFLISCLSCLISCLSCLMSRLSFWTSLRPADAATANASISGVSPTIDFRLIHTLLRRSLAAGLAMKELLSESFDRWNCGKLHMVTTDKRTKCACAHAYGSLSD